MDTVEWYVVLCSRFQGSIMAFSSVFIFNLLGRASLKKKKEEECRYLYNSLIRGKNIEFHSATCLVNIGY